MASITDLSYTDNMASSKQPFLTDLRETLDSIQSYVNTTIVDALLDIVGDAWPSGYAFTTDGTTNFTSSNLYDKLTASDSYTGGDISISTTGAWTDLDASNASITFTPDYLAGDFKLTAQFMVKAVTTNATNEVEVRFRLTDSSTTSTFVATFHSDTAASGTTTMIPINLVHHFDSMAASSQTVKIQYYIQTLTATTLTVAANTDEPIVMLAEKI